MRYFVEIRSDYFETWEERGSVLLPPGSDELMVEGALAALGVYAPRGRDLLEWLDSEVATIRDSSGQLMVRMIGVPKLALEAR